MRWTRCCGFGTVNHLSVCVAELTHAFGRLDPLNPATETVLKELARTVADIPPHRLATAGTAAVIEAGILAGLLFRLGDLRAGQELAALNDATLYLHALSHGQVILTRNLRDFDVLNQILPDGQVLFYEQRPENVNHAQAETQRESHRRSALSQHPSSGTPCTASMNPLVFWPCTL